MRLFAYYVFHSVLNTLKKLLKTWVAVFLVLCVAGGLLGGIIGTVISFVEDQNEAKVESVEEEDEDDADDADEDDDEIGFSFTADIEKYMKEYDLTPANIVDFCISAVFFLILATNVSNAQNSGKIFLPADVPMMFASPLKPQSVLLFRLTCTLGSSFFVSLFMIFQMPNLMVNAGLGFWGALSCIVVYMLILMFSTLVQVTFYTITSKFNNGIELTNRILIGVYALIGVGFAAYITISKKELIPAVFGYFAGPKTHWVPFWGWLRGITYYAVNGDLKMSGIYLGLFVAACFLTIVFIWKMKADFYEDAMFAAERKAEQLDNAQRASNGATVIREKERKGSIDREGFHFGSGANVFFYKAVYNRFRFATLKIFSKTMIVYLLLAVTVSYVVKTYATGFADLFVIPAAAMGISLSSGSGATGGNSNDEYLLARLIYGEARGEPYTGQVAVAAVVLNRVKSSSFPNTIAGVIYQSGAFTAVSDGQINLTPNATALRAARDAMNGWDPTYGCLFYYNPRTATSAWIRSKKINLTIGEHVFCV